MRWAFAAAIVLVATAVHAETQEACEAKWLAAEKAGIVSGVGMVGTTPTAAVDEETFLKADFDTKTGFAVTLDCAVAGPGKHLAEIEFISNRTHKRLARWTPVKGLVVD
ncbi:hypothetical protein [Mesorhizobium sp. B2-6-5]|uniref:hypothetical protein n=1 Tax=Mesorhizobium sp. B2-6-5 TaxID=2589912 RepID=UPI00112C1AC6|nr:hypothetical protein [Mesorhizobium sp. B2-6-5]TPJ34276.1 hypothetical protein FJ432_30095 [Mesorhizobium sp. B2-6-5]